MSLARDFAGLRRIGRSGLVHVERDKAREGCSIGEGSGAKSERYGEMLMTRTKRLLSAALVAATLALPVATAQAVPAIGIHATAPSAATATVEQVRWRGRGVGIGIGAGILGGAIIGGALAAPYYYDRPYAYYPAPRYYAPAPSYYAAPPPGDADAYCFSRFRSYDPRTRTYMGYDGYRHPCP